SNLMPWPVMSPCWRSLSREAAQGWGLLNGHDPVMYLDPSPPLKTAERGVDALPGAPCLMREFLLAQGGPDDAVAAPGQAEQDLSDAAGQIQEDQVGSGLGQSAQGGRCRVQQGLDHRRLPRADALHRF